MLIFIFVLFLIFKLAGAVAWSWWLVTLPLWLMLACLINQKTFGFNPIESACKPFKCGKEDDK